MLWNAGRVVAGSMMRNARKLTVLTETIRVAIAA
jgi:hypothetical protein